MSEKDSLSVEIRTADADDAAALTRLCQEMDLAELGTVITDESEVRLWITEPDAGARVALVSDRVAAFACLRHRPWSDELRVRLACLPGVAEAGGAMLDRIRDEAAAAGAGRLTLWQVADGILTRQLIDRGWKPVRTYVHMTCELTASIKPVTPPGIVIETAVDDMQRRRVHEVIDEAVAGHWDHRHLPFEEFYMAQAARAGHDPELWYVALADDEPAGAVIARTPGQTGLIAWLGTVARFRNRGVASALLATTFDALRQRGIRHVHVDVDVANATNAVAVYQRAGMSEQFRITQWRLSLTR